MSVIDRIPNPLSRLSVAAAIAAAVLAAGSVSSRADVIADSYAEFSGTQGQDNWTYGYWSVPGPGSEPAYDPAVDFVAFAGGADNPSAWDGTTQLWTGTAWDLNTAAAQPWTAIGGPAADPPEAVNSHPNGSNQAAGIQFAMIRWEADVTETTSVGVTWFLRKNNTSGNGVTGIVYHNGELKDMATIAGTNNVDGVTRTYYLNIEPGDLIEFALSPLGTDNSYADGSDGSRMRVVIDDSVPDPAFQPDGSLFIPHDTPDVDGDGLPDAWEETYFPGDLTKLGSGQDFDSDGALDEQEFLRGSNPTLTDTDGDGLLDGVEDGSGTFVSATQTGSSPTDADSDGDTISDADEVNGSPQTNPNRADTDNDGYTDPDEIFFGSNPADAGDSPVSQALADFQSEFSGVQGQDDWNYGYRNLTLDGGIVEEYDPVADFIPFTGGDGQGAYDQFADPQQLWDGTGWDLSKDPSAPWTEIRAAGAHPNGVNSSPNEEHWCISRWTASEITEPTAVAIWYFLAKTNPNGPGTSVQLHVNGVMVDKISTNNAQGVLQRFFVNLEPDDIVDVALTPEAPTGDRNDGSDGSVFWMRVDQRIPDEPRQPDGSLFIPVDWLSEDTDADNLPDPWELIYAADLTTLSGAGDADSDGLTDRGEFDRDTDPTAADTDNDGLNDIAETATGTYVSPADTGSLPRNPDTDGDGLTDGDEVSDANGFVTDPNLADTDSDLFDDKLEIEGGWDPLDPNNNPSTTELANSYSQFSDSQGQDGWYYGYYNLTLDSVDNGGDGVYGTEDFVAFDPAVDWTGTNWDPNPTASGPWTFIGVDDGRMVNSGHPNGTNSAPNEEQWAMLRWEAEVPTQCPAALIWQLAAQNTAGGGGTGGVLFVNGVQLDAAVVGGTDGTGFRRVYYYNLLPGDIVELALTPENTDGSRGDGSDGSFWHLAVNTAIPPNPTQPDGTPFVPQKGSGFRIVAIETDEITGDITVTWTSSPNGSYVVEASRDMSDWLEIDDSVPSGGLQTSYVITPPSDADNYFIRVRVAE